MTPKTTLMLLLLCSFSLSAAGCAKEAPQAVAMFTQEAVDTGSVIGFVVDEEFVPMKGATVGLVGYPQTNVTTSSAGHFQIINIPPGSYRLHVVLTGYVGDIRDIVVEPGGELREQLGVKRLPVKEEYYEIMTYLGYIQCGYAYGTTFDVNGYANVACEDANNDGMRTQATTYLGPKVDTLYDELVWQNSAATNPSGELRLEVGYDFNDCESDERLCNSEVYYFGGQGPSVLRSRMDAPLQGIDREALNETFPIFHHVWPPVPSEPPFVTLVTAQSFTLYTTAFYGAKMPESYSALPEA